MDGLTTGTVTGIVLVLIWYLKYTTRQNTKRETDAYNERMKREEKHDEIQKEDRDFNRGLITGALKDIHNTGLENAELNRKSIAKQKNYQKESVLTLKIIADKLNGGTEGMRAITKLKEIDKKDRRKVDKKVEVDRRE